MFTKRNERVQCADHQPPNSKQYDTCFVLRIWKKSSTGNSIRPRRLVKMAHKSARQPHPILKFIFPSSCLQVYDSFISAGRFKTKANCLSGALMLTLCISIRKRLCVVRVQHLALQKAHVQTTAAPKYISIYLFTGRWVNRITLAKETVVAIKSMFTQFKVIIFSNMKPAAVESIAWNTSQDYKGLSQQRELHDRRFQGCCYPQQVNETRRNVLQRTNKS